MSLTEKLGADEPILMIDGSFKAVKDIQVGDIIMGTDNQRGTVTSICSAISKMYQVTPTIGEPFKVSDKFIFSLRCGTKTKITKLQTYYKVRWIEDGHSVSEYFKFSSFKSEEEAEKEALNFIEYLNPKIGIMSISIEDYTIKPKGEWKKMYKGYRTSVDFPHRDVGVDLDPYCLGLWLGDGTSAGSTITTIDREIIDKIQQIYPDLWVKQLKDKKNFSIRAFKPRPSRLNNPSPNRFLNGLKHYNLIDNKHIPADFKYNDRETRLKVLAGFLDTDGNFDKNCYEIAQKSDINAEGIIFLARSLGFQCTNNKREKTCTNSSHGRVTGIYNIIMISGEGLETIPTILERKKAAPRR